MVFDGYNNSETNFVITMHSPVYKNPGASRGGSGYNIKQSAGSILEQTVSGYPEIHFFSAHTHKMYNVDNLSTDHVYEHNAGAVCASAMSPSISTVSSITAASRSSLPRKSSTSAAVTKPR